MGFLSRKPTSNEAAPESSPWGGNELMDNFTLLLNGDGAKCHECRRVTRKCFLKSGLCPDCYSKKYEKQSPALEQEKERRARANVGCASGEAGEAD